MQSFFENFFRDLVKLPAHRAGLPGHAVASKMRANEISFFTVPLDPAYKAGLPGHLPAKYPSDPFPKALINRLPSSRGEGELVPLSPVWSEIFT
jgi:hypothetical protein